MTARKRPAASKPQPSAKPAPKKAAAASKSDSKAGSKGSPKTVVASKAPAKASPKASAKAPPQPTPKAVPEPKPVPEKVPPRGTLIPKLHKALKAHYKPFAADTSRPILDQVLIACCLENAPSDVAEKAFARLVGTYFDLNEIRVTTVAELAEVLSDLPDPSHAALSLRRALQGVFESTYAFSLEHAKKHSLAHGIKVLEGLRGVPPFVVHYVAATALGGHLIPLDRGALSALWLCGLITKQEYDTGKVAGLERTLPKKAGTEFASLLHQFGIDVLTNLHGNTVRKVALAVNPAAKDRFPKRGEPLPAPVPPPLSAKEASAAGEDHHLRPAGPQAAARPAGKTPQPPAGSGPKKTDGKTKSGPKPFVVKPLSIKPPPPPAEPAPPEPAKKAPGPAKPPSGKTAAGKHSDQLTKRKPR
jgi:hypothetical protein